MSERSKSSENPSSELALSRYLLVSQVLSLEHQGVVRAEAAEQVAARVHRALNGDVLVRSARTIQRWVAAWERDGVGGLEPAERTRTSSSLVLPQDFLDFLRIQKQLDIRASIPELIQRAVELGIVEANAKPDRTTVWRACRRMGVTTRGKRGRSYDHLVPTPYTPEHHRQSSLHQRQQRSQHPLHSTTRVTRFIRSRGHTRIAERDREAIQHLDVLVQSVGHGGIQFARSVQQVDEIMHALGRTA